LIFNHHPYDGEKLGFHLEKLGELIPKRYPLVIEQFANLKMAIEIVDFPINIMVIFHSSWMNDEFFIPIIFFRAVETTNQPRYWVV